MLKDVESQLFQMGVRCTAIIARLPALGFFTKRIMRVLGSLTLFVKEAKIQNSIGNTAKEWQRMFPKPESNPIILVSDETVYAEIRTHCPLRGSGDTQACHRLMEYDRRMLEKIGGQLVVLDSQAEPGRTYCRVAIRRHNKDISDLTPAHRK